MPAAERDRAQVIAVSADPGRDTRATMAAFLRRYRLAARTEYLTGSLADMQSVWRAWGLAARVQGRERYYALMFGNDDSGSVRLVRRRHCETTLAAQKFPWKLDQAYDLVLEVSDRRLRASIDGTVLFDVEDQSSDALDAGGVALMVDTGSIATEAVRVSPL